MFMTRVKQIETIIADLSAEGLLDDTLIVVGDFFVSSFSNCVHL